MSYMDGMGSRLTSIHAAFGVVLSGKLYVHEVDLELLVGLDTNEKW